MSTRIIGSHYLDSALESAMSQTPQFGQWFESLSASAQERLNDSFINYGDDPQNIINTISQMGYIGPAMFIGGQNTGLAGGTNWYFTEQGPMIAGENFQNPETIDGLSLIDPNVAGQQLQAMDPGWGGGLGGLIGSAVEGFAANPAISIPALFLGLQGFEGAAAPSGSTLDQFTNFIPSAEYGGVTPAADAVSAPAGSQQAADALAQSTYDVAAASGIPGYDPELTSGVASGGGAGSTLAGAGGGAMTTATGSGAIGDIANVIGAVSGLNTLLGGGASPVNSAGGTPTAYVPTGRGPADTAWQDLLKQIIQRTSGVTGTVDPVLSNWLKNTLGIDTTGMIGAGDQAGAQYGDLAKLLQAYSAILGNEAAGDIGRKRDVVSAGMDVYNLGRDPQETLRARELQRLIDSTRAAQSARGITMSPFAAAGESEAVKNFGIDWQNNQLERAIRALNAMGGAQDVATRIGQGVGANLSGSREFAAGVPGATLAAGRAPVAARKEAFGIPGQAAQDYATAMYNVGSVPMANIQSQIIPYLNYGTGAGASAFGQGATNRQFTANENTAAMNALLTALKSLGTSANTPGSWLSGLWDRMTTPAWTSNTEFAT